MVGVKSSALHPPELWELAGTCPVLPRQLPERSWRDRGVGEQGPVCGPVAPWVPNSSGKFYCNEDIFSRLGLLGQVKENTSRASHILFVAQDLIPVPRVSA